MSKAAIKFLQSLSRTKSKTQFAFEDSERSNWNYVPIERKGIPLRELTTEQRKVGMDLLHTALSDTGLIKPLLLLNSNWYCGGREPSGK
jgi:hypothetical protein